MQRNERVVVVLTDAAGLVGDPRFARLLAVAETEVTVQYEDDGTKDAIASTYVQLCEPLTVEQAANKVRDAAANQAAAQELLQEADRICNERVKRMHLAQMKVEWANVDLLRAAREGRF